MPAQLARLQRATFTADGLSFHSDDGFTRALKDGCFLLKAPLDFDPAPAIRLCREFHLEQDAAHAGEGACYRGFRAIDSVYFGRDQYQTHHVLLDREARKRWLPDEVCSVAECMNAVGLTILRDVLTRISIPEQYWTELTGGAVNDRGTHWFAASHYRSHLALPGCATHHDTGFITVLYFDASGLEGRFGDRWLCIAPEPDHLLVNFGRSLELLTEELATPVHSLLHRVAHTARNELGQERISFAAFINPPATGQLFRYAPKTGPLSLMDVATYLAEFNRTTWNDHHDSFGIK